MFIRVTAKRWRHEDQRFEIPDLTRFPRDKWLNGLVLMADRHFAEAYATGLSIESVADALNAFLAEVGAGADLMKSFPEADEAGDDWRVLIEMRTPESIARENKMMGEFFSNLPARPTSGRVVITDKGIRHIKD